MRTAEHAPEGLDAAAPAAASAPADPDRTARARLRDAAIECFAAEGFDASVRSIAKRAGVSAGLVRHHFGSKEALREECDREVLGRFRAMKRDGLQAGPGSVLAQIAAADEHGVMLVYILRSVRDGGPAGRAFLEQMIDDAREYTAEAVAGGILKPSRNEEARVRHLVTQSVGGLIAQLTLHPDIALADFVGVVRRVLAESALPTLEIFTEGLLADRRYLDEYLLYIGDPPEPSA